MLKQSSHQVLENLAFKFLLQMTKDFNSSTASTISTSWIQCIAFRRKLWTNTYLNLESDLPTSKRCWCGWIYQNEDLKSTVVGLPILLPSLGTIAFWLTVKTGNLWSWLGVWFSFLLPPLMCESVLIFLNSMDSILADKVLKKTRLDLKKNVSRYTIACPQMLGGPSLRLGIPKETA